MALAIGTCTIVNGVVGGSGLAKAIGDAHATAFNAISMNAATRGQLLSNGFFEAFSNALAAAIVNQITANAAVSVSVRTTDVGLQTSTAAASPTGGPAATKTLTGTIA